MVKPQQLPEEFVGLLPWMERWAFGDDEANERAAKFANTEEATLRELVNSVTSRLDDIQNYLASFGDQPLPERGRILKALSEASAAAERYLLSRSAERV